MTPERDKASRKTLVSAIDLAVLTADNTPAAVSLKGYGGATLALNVGVGGITFTGANKIEFVLTHSDDGAAYTPVTDDDVIKDALAPATITNGIVRALTAAHAAASLQKLGYIGGKGFVKLLADFSGTHGTGTPISAIWTLESPDFQGAA